MPKTLSRKTQGFWKNAEVASLTDFKTRGLALRIFKQKARGKKSSVQYPDTTQILFEYWLDMQNKAYLSSSEYYSDMDKGVETTISEGISEEPEIDREALLRSWTTLISGPRIFSQEKNVYKLYENLVAKLRQILESEPDLGRGVLKEFEQYARRIIAVNKTKLVSASVREWTSIEDPTWKQLILDFTVDSKPKIALILWDNLSNELSTFINSRYGRESTKLHEILSVNVRWK